MSPQGGRISRGTRVHMKTTCTLILHESKLPFMYHMLLYPRKLRIYHTLKMLFFFFLKFGHTMTIVPSLTCWLGENQTIILLAFLN